MDTPLAWDEGFSGLNLLIVKRVEKLLQCIPVDNKQNRPMVNIAQICKERNNDSDNDDVMFSLMMMIMMIINDEGNDEDDDGAVD